MAYVMNAKWLIMDDLWITNNEWLTAELWMMTDARLQMTYMAEDCWIITNKDEIQPHNNLLIPTY